MRGGRFMDTGTDALTTLVEAALSGFTPEEMPFRSHESSGSQQLSGW